MKSKEKFAIGDESITRFVVRTQVLDKDVAKNMAKEMLSKLPACQK